MFYVSGLAWYKRKTIFHRWAFHSIRGLLSHTSIFGILRQSRQLLLCGDSGAFLRYTCIHSGTSTLFKVGESDYTAADDLLLLQASPAPHCCSIPTASIRKALHCSPPVSLCPGAFCYPLPLVSTLNRITGTSEDHLIQPLYDHPGTYPRWFSMPPELETPQPL